MVLICFLFIQSLFFFVSNTRNHRGSTGYAILHADDSKHDFYDLGMTLISLIDYWR